MEVSELDYCLPIIATRLAKQHLEGLVLRVIGHAINDPPIRDVIYIGGYSMIGCQSQTSPLWSLMVMIK
jgi:hypothetical protein